MAKFEDIKSANETISTTNIKGKEYAEVNQRIKAFRMVFPEGTIETEILSLQDGVCTMKATVRNANEVLGTGHAQEKESSSFINKTSFIENCETSAVGRALGMCGFGIDTSICSAEELSNAILNQKEEVVKCIRCKKPIPEFTDKKGKHWTPDAFANAYGGKCPDCYKKDMGRDGTTGQEYQL